MNCILCALRDYVLENEFFYAVFDRMPVNEGHMLLIVKRHAETYFDLTQDERSALLSLLDEAKKLIDDKYHPNGYNIGINCGECSGQSVMHMHLHLIPRYKGDTKSPQGGVRGVIPEKMIY